MFDARFLIRRFPQLFGALNDGLASPQAAEPAVVMCVWWASVNASLPVFGAPDRLRRFTADDLNEWFQLYSEEAVFKATFESQILPVSRLSDMKSCESESLERRMGLSPAALQAIECSVVGIFTRRVVMPYIWWHDAQPWGDFKDACSGEENALHRLVKIDRLVLDAPVIKSHWGPRMKADDRLRERIAHHELDGLNQHLEPDPSTTKVVMRLDPFQRRKQKLRFAAHLQLWAGRRGLSLPPKRISAIFDAMHAEFGWPDDEFDDMPVGDGLRVQLGRSRNAIQPKKSETAG